MGAESVDIQVDDDREQELEAKPEEDSKGEESSSLVVSSRFDAVVSRGLVASSLHAVVVPRESDETGRVQKTPSVGPRHWNLQRKGKRLGQTDEGNE